MNAWMAMEARFGLEVYPKRPVVIVKGKGARLWDEDGRTYIDCVTGNGVALVGHSNPAVVKAIYRQASQLITCPGIFYNDVRAQFLQKLTEVVPAGLQRTFLCNSGAESIEAAIKFARLTTGKTEIIAAQHGFHGRTFGALSATHQPRYKKGVAPLVPGFHHVPFNQIEPLTAALTEQTAAILLEIVQGEGGVHIGEPTYFQQVQQLCREHDILLIIDEVQTGFGRTGKWFACEHMGVQPDMLCLAKGIAGGVPMGAVVVNDQITVPMGMHGSTFGGNPLACAAALATIQYLEDQRLPEQAAGKGAYLVSRLRQMDLPLVRDIRHLGLMIGIELRVRVRPIILRLIQEGILTLPAGKTVLRLLPPLTISYPEMDQVVDALSRVLR